MPALPTGDDLKTLPLRAVVAYAHRCAARAARRCVPSAGGATTAFGCGEAIRRALRPAAKIAAGEPVPARELTAAEDVIVAAVARLGRQTEGPGAGEQGGLRGDAAGRAVALTANAAYAALAAAAAVADEAGGSRSIRGHRAVLSAVTAAEAAAGACPAIRIGMQRDFGFLSRLNLGAFPDPGRGVDVSDDGPLGDLGEDARRDAIRRGAASEPPPAEIAPDAVEETQSIAEPPPAEPPLAPQKAEPRRIASELLPAGDPSAGGSPFPPALTDPFASPFLAPGWSPALAAAPACSPSPGSTGDPVGASARSAAALARREAALSTRDAALCTREAAFAEREADLADRAAELEEHDAEFARREADLRERERILEEGRRALADRTRAAAGELTAARADRQELADAAAALRRVFERHAVFSAAPADAAPADAAPADVRPADVRPADVAVSI